MEQEPPRVGLALRPGLLRDALAAGLPRHGLRVVGACRPHHAALGPVLVARPDVLLLAVEDESLEAGRSQACLRRATLAGVAVVALSDVPRRPADAPLAPGVVAAVAREDPLEVLVERLRAAAAGGRRTRRQLVAVPPPPAGRPALSAQEERTLVLYVSGLKLVAVARRLGVRYDTAKGYLDRVRDKYAAAGRPARTKTDLYRVALEDGRLGPDGPALPGQEAAGPSAGPALDLSTGEPDRPDEAGRPTG